MTRTILYLTPLFFFALNATAQDAKVMELGQQTFQMCIACHGPDGKGVKAGDLNMAPSLPESAFIKGNNKDLISSIVMKGILKQDNKYVQAMLPLETVLKDEQIAAVVTYVTSQFGGKKETVKANEVAKWRKQFASQKSPYKRKDVENLLKSANAPELLSEMKYAFYPGNWKKLPDFSKLTPDKTGQLKKNKITLDPAKDFKHGFGMIFEAKLTVPTTEVYEFSLGSDDGSALAIDGETVIGNDGVHPNTIKKGKEKLEAGLHTLKVLYFEGGGQRSLSLAVKTKSLGEIQLSKDKVKKGGGGQSYDPILLTARNPNEAIVHRAFLPNAKPRAIGVGYPGAVNLCWDADTLNLAYIWRGEFMDVARHWNGRGSASAPQGQDTLRTAQGLPFQVLESMDEPWVPFSEAKIKYEQDKADPQKEITYNIKHPDYQFRGYRLDKNRFPTFKYDYQDSNITDSFAPADVDGVKAIVRTLTIKGKATEQTYLRIADTGPLTIDAGWIDIGGKVKIKLEGAEHVIRQSGGKKELLAPIDNQTKLTITYRWEAPLKVINK